MNEALHRIPDGLHFAPRPKFSTLILVPFSDFDSGECAVETATLYVSAVIPSPRDSVYRALSDPNLHSAFTGSRSELDPRPGGYFSYFGGMITGEYVSLDTSRAIVQKLHAAPWPAGHHAIVSTTLREFQDGSSTLVAVMEEDVPRDALRDVMEGWGDYWSSLSQFFRQEKEEVVRRFVEEYKNLHNIDIVDELVHEDCKIHIPLPGLPQGREGMRINGRLVTDAFPDVHVEREFLLTDGDIVMERAIAKASHQGALMGIAPTGNPVGWTELHAYRVEDGLITEVWSEPDLLRVMVDIGAVSLPSN